MDYDKSCEILQQGIPAIKYNFSNDGHRKVILKLNEARTHLIYESEQPKSGCLNKLSGVNKRSIPLSAFVNMVYGGQTSTFRRHTKIWVEKFIADNMRNQLRMPKYDSDDEPEAPQKNPEENGPDEESKGSELLKLPTEVKLVNQGLEQSFRDEVVEEKPANPWAKAFGGGKKKKEKKVDFKALAKNYQFHSWDCVSLIRYKYATTLDFVIKDNTSLMVFLNVAGHHIMQQDDSQFMRVYNKLKFKMKLSYGPWVQGKQFKWFVVDALKKTVEEKR